MTKLMRLGLPNRVIQNAPVFDGLYQDGQSEDRNANALVVHIATHTE